VPAFAQPPIRRSTVEAQTGDGDAETAHVGGLLDGVAGNEAAGDQAQFLRSMRQRDTPGARVGAWLLPAPIDQHDEIRVGGETGSRGERPAKQMPTGRRQKLAAGHQRGT